MIQRKSIEEEDFTKATGIIILDSSYSSSGCINSAFAVRDYTIDCRLKLIDIIKGYHIWWCSVHHQPHTHCCSAILRQEKDNPFIVIKDWCEREGYELVKKENIKE